MKIQLKTAKPRNPFATLAKQRNAGAHRADNLARQQRRSEKQQLCALVRGSKEWKDA
ncbi:hypothetical protein V8J88_02395 [Massilia sp. W12]|uniref:hypothetical protein n=1 Tax=Massilia sp. W12 TaxID=3126507 RepID=UPI0030CD9E5F